MVMSSVKRPQKGDVVELRVDRMATGGRGVGRLDDFVLFVRGGVPGDLVRAKIYKRKKTYGEAHLVQVLTVSPDRVPPPCPYAGTCGGCSWQHVAYEKQLQWKQDLVYEPLARIGGLREVVVRPVISSPQIFGYRNKMEFTFSDRPWLPEEAYRERGREDGFGLGLHVPGSFSRVLDMEYCLLQQETGNEILREVKDYARESGLPVYGLKTHQGYWRYLAIRHSSARDQWMVNVVTSEERPETLMPLARRLSGRFGNVTTMVNNINSRRASIALGDQETVLLGPGYLYDRIGEWVFRISANSFFQTNTRAAALLYEKVVEYARPRPSDLVLDLYSGTGTIPIFMAGRVREVLGMEITPEAIADAQYNCQENRVENCRFICGDIREKMKELEVRPDLMVIDPPRVGMHPRVLSAALALAPERMVYVSCNPPTLARDLALMAEHYHILEVQPVDMFPHTHHVEAVARLIRKDSTGAWTGA